MKLNSAYIAIALAAASMAPVAANASYSDSFNIPAADANARRGALMPYTRYDSDKAALSGGASLKTSYDVDPYNIGSQASDLSYVSLPSNGAAAEWTVDKAGDGVTLRFNMPDSSDGMGLNGSLDIYVNGVKDQTVSLTSYYMYQYFSYWSGDPADAPNGSIPCFAWDEVHFRLNHKLNAGDRIKVQSTGAGGHAYAVDFVEVEEIPAAIGRPENSISVADYGARPNDGADDYNAFTQAMAAAAAQGKTLYIPEGEWHLRTMWHVYGNGIKITGAGIWYTNIKFTNPNTSGGGISGGSGNAVCDCNNVEICHFYLNSSLRSRYYQQAIYKCFMDVFAGGSVIHDIWEDHFECGFWLGDYNGSMQYSDNLKIINCRIRNNLADGVNFCQGTSNATVYNCNIRNCGDDGLAIWNNDYNGAKDESFNTFAYNTIDFIWRAGGIAIYGGNGHKIYNNYIRDTFMSSGIHFNTTFPGHKFNNNSQGIKFDNNILVNCGTNYDCWHEDLAAIDIKEMVNNVTFNNTQIYNSRFYAMRFMSGPTNIHINNTTILGAGMAGKPVDYSCVQHSACAIRLQNNNITFGGTTLIGGVKADQIGNNSTWPVWTDNNKALANSIGYTYTNNSYTVPGYPDADTIQTGGIGDNNNDDPQPPTPTNPYEKWYIGIGFGDDWEEEHHEVHPDEHGIARFGELVTLGEWFRIRMYNGNDGSAVTLYGPSISEPGAWIAATPRPDTQDGAFRITNPLLRNFALITVDVPGNKVKIENSENASPYTLNIRYDNTQTAWTTVRAHVWNDQHWASVDIDLKPSTGNIWYSDAKLAFAPTHILFFNGNWGGDNQTPDMAFTNDTTYDFHGATAIDTLGADDPDLPAIYYDLQGRIVETPYAGLYIMVRGDKAVKVRF